MNPAAAPARNAHPLLRLLLAHPELLAEHAIAYGALAAEDGQLLLLRWQRQARLRLMAAASGLLALGFAGQGLMLAVLLAPLQPLQPLALAVLLALPLLMLGLALACHQAAAQLRPRAPGSQAFAAVQRQLAADLAMLREAAVLRGAAVPRP